MDIDLHLSYITMLKMNGKQFSYNSKSDCYFLNCDKYIYISYIIIFKNSFDILFSYKAKFILESIFNDLKIYDINITKLNKNYMGYKFTGNLKSMIESLVYLEKLMKEE